MQIGHLLSTVWTGFIYFSVYQLNMLQQVRFEQCFVITQVTEVVLFLNMNCFDMFARNLSQCGHCMVLVSECTLPTSLNGFSKSCGAKLLTYPTSINFPRLTSCAFLNRFWNMLYTHIHWKHGSLFSNGRASCAHSNLPDIFHTPDSEFSLLLHPHYQWTPKDLFHHQTTSTTSCITRIPGLGTNSRVLRKFLCKQLHWPRTCRGRRWCRGWSSTCSLSGGGEGWHHTGGHLLGLWWHSLT